MTMKKEKVIMSPDGVRWSFSQANLQKLLFFLSFPVSTRSIFLFINPSLLSLLSFSPSLFPVLPRRLCHLRPVRQALSPHVDVLLQRPAHLSHHAQLPHRGREPVHPAAPAIHQGGSPVPPRPLRLEQVRLPVRHRPR